MGSVVAGVGGVRWRPDAQSEAAEAGISELNCRPACELPATEHAGVASHEGYSEPLSVAFVGSMLAVDK